MNRTSAAAALLLSIGLLAGCGGGDDEPSVTQFPEGYAPAVQTRIDGQATAKDCAALQREFDVAEDSQKQGRIDLMEYIAQAMEGAGCP